jgi:RNA polymerase sigma-70 factor (ECF subfamily)
MSDWEMVGEEELILTAQAGDPSAFGELYSRYAACVFRFVYAHLDNRLDAEDLTEEVFLRAWRALPQFRQQGFPFSAFLFRIARNAMVDYYRLSKHKRSTVAISETQVEVDPIAQPTEAVSRQLEHQELNRALSNLKDEYHTVLALRFFSGLTPAETAKVMKRSIGAIRVLQFRALSALRLLMDKNEWS